MGEDKKKSMNISDREFIEFLEDLKSQDYHAFMCLVIESLKSFPETAAEDNVPLETKESALKKVIEYFESREEFEVCVEVRDITKYIKENHGKKGQVSGNEQ